MTNVLGHHDIHHVIRLGERQKVNWSNSVRGVAMSMVGVLIPIYLSKLGYMVPEIIAYFIIAGLAWLALVYPAMWLTYRIGGNRTMAVATVISVGYLVALATIPSHHQLWLPAVLWGAMVAPYWYALRVSFATAMNPDKAGSEVGASAALYLAALGVAPVIGGAIGSAIGIEFTYAAAAVLCVISLTPLLHNDEAALTRRPDLRRNLKIRENISDYIANGCSTVDDFLQGASWPLLVFTVLPTYVGVGAVSSTVTVSTILLTLYVGHRELSKGERRYLRRGGFLMAVVSAARLFISTTAQVFGVNFFYGVSRALVDTPFYTRYYQNARRQPTLEYVFAMQVASAVGWLVVALMTLLFVHLIGGTAALIASLALMIPGSLGLMRIR